MAIKSEHQFEIEAPIKDVWTYFADPPQVVPCLHGAELTEQVNETTYKGKVGFRFGQIRAQFSGTVEILEMNHEEYRMAIRAIGNQVGSIGQAEADIHFHLKLVSETITQVSINAAIGISGKLAQLGGGMMQSIARSMFQRFAKCVQEKLVPAK